MFYIHRWTYSRSCSPPFWGGGCKTEHHNLHAGSDLAKATTRSQLFSAKVRKNRMNQIKDSGNVIIKLQLNENIVRDESSLLIPDIM